MGLYLCVFDGDEEVDGVEVGSYGDFGTFRDTVRDILEEGTSGSRFPILMKHSDCDGTWSPVEAEQLQVELATIAQEFARHPPIPLHDGWKKSVARTLGLSPVNLLDCFFDVDGEPLLDRLRGLCMYSIQRGLPILFQ
jgi:hypothetical protein